MNENRLTEFDQFRFLRKEAGVLAELPGTGGNERLFLVMDCRRFRLARLHIFEGRASRDADAPALFRREFEALSELHHPRLSPLISFGRDDTELFYADAAVDGESLHEYLRRAGPMPPATAMRAVLDLADVLQAEPKGIRTLSHYSSRNLFVKPSEKDGLSLIFSDFTGWDRKEIEDEAEREADKVARVAVTLYSMLAGRIFDLIPPIPFTREAANTPESVKNLLKPVFLHQEGGPAFRELRDFADAARVILRDLTEEEPPRSPRRFFRDWLIQGLNEEHLDLGPDFKLLSKRKGPASSLFEDGYTIDAANTKGLTYKRLRFHLFPNQASIPRTSWMDQHRYSLRALGRPLPNQEPVESMLCDDRFCLLGEVWIDGVDLAVIVQELGPLSFDDAREIGKKLTAALDSMEAVAGSCPIWWLPPENLFAVTGSQHPDSVRHALDKHGIDTWKRTPLRLRLHQTGEALLEGVNLPGSLVDLLHTGSKDHADARRSAVLLPILWFVVTGERLNWREKLPHHNGFPKEIQDLLEETRRHLVECPDREQGRLLDRIASTLRVKTLELEPFTSGTGPLALGKQSCRQLLPESPMAAFASATGAPGDQAGQLEPGNNGKRGGHAIPEKKKAAGKADESQAAEVEEKTESAGMKTESGPSGELEAAPKEETHWVKRVANIPVPASQEDENIPAEEEDPDDTPGDGFAERLIFPNAKRKREEKTAGTSPRGKRRKKSANRPFPIRTKHRRIRPQGKSLIPMMIFLVTASALSGIIWGGVTVYKHLSTTINQQVLSETFALVQYAPVTISASEFALPRLSNSPGKNPSASEEPAAAAPPSVLPPVTVASTVEDAIAAGDKAQISRQFPAAITCYLRALEIDSQSSAAKEKISETTERWTSGDGPGIQTQAVADLVEKAAFHSHEASRLLAEFYLERDHEMGLRWLQRSAEAGHPRHQVILGLIFARGQLVPQELNIATRWFQRAANKGDVDGQFHFGECLILGEGITRDAPRGIDFLDRAARAGDSRALELLGICHAKGDGVNPDGKKAKEYFEQAVERGNVSAYYNLAVRYAKGHGVERNETIAARTFLDGAEKGNVPCMYAFGRCLETGFGVDQSLEQAKTWLTKAASLGDIEAQAWCANNEVPFDKPAELLSGF